MHEILAFGGHGKQANSALRTSIMETEARACVNVGIMFGAKAIAFDERASMEMILDGAVLRLQPQ